MGNGGEFFTFCGEPQQFSLGDFWHWHSHGLLNNITRASLAEFIVAHALGVHGGGPLPRWESHDLLFMDRRIEIKASGYVQEWKQAVNTNPRFSIRQTRKWDDAAGYEGKARRNSDMYIFCVLAETDRSGLNPLLLDKWEFYTVLTSALDNQLGAQKSVGMGAICRLRPEPVACPSLRGEVVRLFGKENG